MLNENTPQSAKLEGAKVFNNVCPDLSTISVNGKAALEYAERGWKVFPCKANGKVPITKNGQNNATDDSVQIRDWWGKNPNANIGLFLKPSGLVAVDVDSYKTDCEWQSFTVGLDMPDTLTQTSARGGTHFLFQDDGKAFKGKLCDGVDVKHNGYIMVAPSTFEGKAYEWFNDDEPAPAPDWLPREGEIVNDNTSISFADVIVPPNLSRGRIESLLEAVSAADLPYEKWVNVGMALHFQFDGSEEGFNLWDEWSVLDLRYDGRPDLFKRWSGFANRPAKPVTLATVMMWANEKGTEWKLPKWARGWVYNEKLIEFHEVDTGHSISSAAFNARFTREPDCLAADTTAAKLVLYHMQTVANTMYWPGAGAFFDHDSLTYVNTYRTHDVDPKPPMSFEAEMGVQTIVDHASELLPDAREAGLLLDFLAYVYQNPGSRVRWAILLHGIEGNGKSFWVELMKRLLGRNAREVAGTTVMERFTGWGMNSQFTAIEEIRVPEKGKYAVIEKLKPFITNDTVNIEKKGQDDRVVPNFASYMLLSNHDDALPFGETDRRYCVLATRHKSKADLPGERYYQDLFSALNEHIDAIAYFFANREIGNEFNPNGHAPYTKGKAAMLEATKSGPRLAVEEAIQELDCAVINDDIVYVGAMRELEYKLPIHVKLPDPRSIARELKDMGYQKIVVGNNSRAPKIQGRERVIYHQPDRLDEGSAVASVRQFITGSPF